jgi:peptide/nickel transport system substrate-binding protein
MITDSRPRRRVSGALASIAAALVLAACGQTDTKSAAEKSPSAQTAASAGPRGTLAVGLPTLGTAENYLPWLEAGREGWLVLGALYESLVDSDPVTGDYTPCLAERYEIEDGGGTWRFFLKHGVKFHDGGDLTADDVKFSYEMYVSDHSVNAAKPVFTALVEGVDIVDPHQIVFRLKRVDVTFLGRFGNSAFGVASKKYVERVGEKEAAAKPVGSGPFRFVEHKRQVSVTFEAVPDHWRETARFKTLELRRIPDQAARLAMLRAGEIGVTEVPFKLKREAEAAGMKLIKLPWASIYHVQLGGQLLPSRETFDPSVPWVGDYDNPESQRRALLVRRALNLAIDRQAIIDGVFEGEGVPATAPYFVPGSEFVPGDLKPYPYDPAEAKRLMAEAGYAKGFPREFDMLLMPWVGRSEMVDVSEAVAGYWERNLGLRIKRRPIDFGNYAANVGAPRRTPWVAWAQGFGPRPMQEPIAAMDSWLTSNARYNSVAERPGIDELAIAIRGETDRDRRREKYRALARLLRDNEWAAPIAAVPSLYAYDPKIVSSWQSQPGDSYMGGYQRAMPAN